MNTKQFILSHLLLGLLVLPFSSQAEDIDIYSGLGSDGNVPNVLFVMDNSANFEASSGGVTCMRQTDGSLLINAGAGTATAMSGTVGGIEQCALWNVVKNLPVNADGTPRVNIGFMVYNGTNIRDVNGLNCGGSLGGCLTQPMIAMTTANKTGVLSWISSWNTSPSASSGNVKAAGKATAATMQEAWAYYKGTTGLSTRSYAGIKPTAGCQKNFLIYIANSFAASAGPGDASSGGPLAALNAAVDAQTNPDTVHITAAQWAAKQAAWKAPILNALDTACLPAPGTYNFASPSSNHSENAGDYADEWTRFMHEADLYTGTGAMAGIQDITTYTVGLLDPTKCKNEYPALLDNMATKGGGKYFATTTYDTIVSAIMKILNEVQAVNSVFSSSSLPVSVNAQGTYLNQIYMGMFRPDVGANPRWSGNLKQYQFIINPTTKALQLGDSIANLAIDSSGGTGFMSANAISFWTCTDLTSPYINTYISPNLTPANIALLQANNQNCSEPAHGFWQNDPSSSKAAALGFDMPDGELVERGGAAQRIRNANLNDDYTTAAGTTTNPRKLYTWCPSGTCTAALTNSANAFADGNASITAAMFGSSTTANISTLSRSGGTVTVTTSGNHGFNTGDLITIANAHPDAYNGTFTITKVSDTSFTYTITVYPPSPATGTYTASKPGPMVTLSSLTRAGTTMTATAANTFTNGQVVTISGAGQAEYNGNYAVSNVTASSFQYTILPVTEGPVLHAGSPAGTTTATASSTIAPSVPCPAPCNKTVAINAVDASTIGVVRAIGSTMVTVTSPSVHNFIVGNTVTLSGVVDASGASVPAYNGNFTITGLPTNKSFTFTTTLTPATTATGTITAGIAGTTANITLTRSGNTATATAAAHGFISGDSIVIAGTAAANETPYLGTYTISNATANTFDYTIVTTPTSPASGLSGATMTATRSTGFDATDRTRLINWVRGEDSQGDEDSLCKTGVATGTANCPSPRVTIRPSVHGDVLHSRPTVLNYGGTTGVIVFYGDNGGVFHAVNGNQKTSLGSVTPGGELWGFIPKEAFIKLNRLRTNSPQLNLPSTPPGISPLPVKKDYFIDGETGVYQKVNSSGVTTKAVLYLSMRRGGNSILALDVTTPTAPVVLWKVDNTGLIDTSGGFNASSDYSELAQTWSQPKVAKVKGYCGGSACSSTNLPSPVLIFGGGYDTAEDLEPPAANTSGRAIYVLDALTGAKVWSASYTAGSTTYSGTTFKATALIPGMNYGIPADIAMLDRDYDGLVDRLYANDVGGNIWRVDLQPGGNATPDNWRVHRLAALGCWTGACSIPTTTTQRKFFYPPEVLTATPDHNYDAVIAGPGDREHPLYVSTSNQRNNRIVLLKDAFTGDSAANMTAANGYPITYGGTNNLFDATSTPWDGSLFGYYITLASGEKVVNAPLAYAGYVYMGTNQPAPASTTSCSSNLGTAMGYRLDPFTGSYQTVTFDGGGLPPSPVAGVVNIMVDGVEKQMSFIIGAGNVECTGGSDCSSSLGVQDPKISPPAKRTRTYWYIENK